MHIDDIDDCEECQRNTGERETEYAETSLGMIV